MGLCNSFEEEESLLVIVILLLQDRVARNFHVRFSMPKDERMFGLMKHPLLDSVNHILCSSCHWSRWLVSLWSLRWNVTTQYVCPLVGAMPIMQDQRENSLQIMKYTEVHGGNNLAFSYQMSWFPRASAKGFLLKISFGVRFLVIIIIIIISIIIIINNIIIIIIFIILSLSFFLLSLLLLSFSLFFLFYFQRTAVASETVPEQPFSGKVRAEC